MAVNLCGLLRTPQRPIDGAFADTEFGSDGGECFPLAAKLNDSARARHHLWTTEDFPFGSNPHDSISTLQSMLWCYLWMRRVRYRHWIVRSPACRSKRGAAKP